MNARLNARISGLGAFPEPIDHALISAFVHLWAVSVLSVLIFENLVLDDIFVILVRFIFVSCLDKVIPLRVELLLQSHGVGIIKSIDMFIVRELLEIGLEIVTVLLLLLCESTKEVGVVGDPTLLLALSHALLTSFMIIGVREFASMEFLNSVEMAVENSDGLFDFNPSFVVVATVGNWQGV